MADLIEDYAKTVTAYKDLEDFAITKMDPEEKAKYLQKRVVDTEGALAKITLDQAKASILAKYKDVEADDLSDVTTVSAAEKLASRIQAKADKVKTSVDAEVNKALEGSMTKEEADKFKKAYGKPREIQDTTQDVQSDGQAKKALGQQLEAEEKIEFGTAKGLETAAKWAAGHALDRMLGKG